MRLALIATLCFAASPAAAYLGSDCLKAIEKNDTATARKIADTLLFHAGDLPDAEAADATECVEKVTGVDHMYVRRAKRIEPTAEHEAAEAARNKREEDAATKMQEYYAKLRADAAQERAAAEAQTSEQRSAAAAEARAAAESQAKLDAFKAGIERRKLERQGAVADRLTEACNRLYGRDPDATITNKLCFDVFWESGLPE